MNAGDGYALDLASPVSHVAASLDRAAPAALSLGELAEGYTHFAGDLARVRQYEGCANDTEAIQWLIRRAVNELTRNGRGGRVQLVEEDGKVGLADGLRIDDLRWHHKKVYAVQDIHKALGDPFDPMSGQFTENIRTDRVAAAKDGMEELRESMRALGWVPEFPALRDKRGVFLTGHRRLRVAEELRAEGVDIADQVKTLDIGDGDEHDARRLRIALASNVGFKPLSPTDRKAIAESLYGDGWTMERIGQALAVSTKTVSNDLANFEPTSKNRTEKRGRPKGTRTSGDLKRNNPDLRRRIRESLQAGTTVHYRNLCTEFSMSTAAVQAAYAIEKDRWERELAAPQTYPATDESRPPPPEPSNDEVPGSSNSPANGLRALAQRVQNLLKIWEAPAEDPASELAELRQLRQAIDERITALSG